MEDVDIVSVTHPGAKVLIVDDDPSFAKSTKRCLGLEGYECEMVHNAEDAKEILEDKDFDLLISDIMMPGTTGAKLLSEVKDTCPDMAIIMASGVDNRDIFIHCLHMGAYGYLIKPFSDSELLINVITSLERRRLKIENKVLRERLDDEEDSDDSEREDDE